MLKGSCRRKCTPLAYPALFAKSQQAHTRFEPGTFRLLLNDGLALIGRLNRAQARETLYRHLSVDSVCQLRGSWTPLAFGAKPSMSVRFKAGGAACELSQVAVVKDKCQACERLQHQHVDKVTFQMPYVGDCER